MEEGGEEVRLLGAWMSPFVNRVNWALKLKGIRYEYVEQDLVNKSPLLLTSNPVYKRVPVLIHNGKPICESLFIIEYLDETWKNNPILPQEPYQRAMARFWANFIEEKFSEVMRKVLFLEGEKQAKEVENAKEALEILEEELKGKKFFGGDQTIGLVDIVLGSVLPTWVGVIEEVACVKVFDPIKYPCLAKWMEDFMGLPVIKESVPDMDKLLAYVHKIRIDALALAAKK